MKKYYLHNGTEQTGPFSIEELKTMGLNSQTPVWFDGLSSWTKFEDVPELKILFSSTPPPFISQAPTPIKQQSNSSQPSVNLEIPKKKKYTALKVIAIVVVLLIIISKISMINDYSSSTDGSQYQERVMTVEEQERSQPSNYLKADGTYNKNFWGDKLKVHGVIKNNATKVTYKDAVVTVTYYSKTSTVLGSNNYTIYENFPPNSEVNFELKIENYKEVKSIGWDVISATTY